MGLNRLILAIAGGATIRGFDFIYILTILLFCEYLRGYCTSYPKISMFLCSISKLSTLFREMIYASYSKFSKELKNSIKIKDRPSRSWVIDTNNILTVLIYNLKIAWPTNISMPFWVPWTIYYQMHMLFFKKELIISR